MNTELRARIETEIRRLGDQLLRDADWTEKLPWETLTSDADSNYSWARGESLYSGSAGIALYLLELGRYTGEQRFTDAAEKAMLSTLEHCRTTPSPYYALITGRMSVSFAALRFFERTGKRSYLDGALELVRNCKEFLTPNSADDFINGTSGTLLGLLLLHEASGKEWLLEVANAYAEHLVRKAHSGEQGLYWDRTHRQIRGLCGFSHGASGIGFVFAEAARYLGNDALAYIAEQAYLYEEHYFNPAVGNWADFRKGIYRDQDQQEHEEHYLSGNLEFFTHGGYMNAWCHGAAGIGLARVRATELFSNPHYRTEAENALAMTHKTNVAFHSIETNFALCHGGGGNADVFIEAYRVWKDERYLAYCETVAEMALEQHAVQGSYRSGFGLAAPGMEDRSLYMGAAGVGYFFLRLLDPMNTPSVEAPALAKTVSKAGEHTAYTALSASKAHLRRTILEKIFPRTITALPAETLDAYFRQQTENNRVKELPNFVAFVEELLPTLANDDNGKAIKSAFAIEREKYTLEMNVESASYLFIRSQMELKRAQEAIGAADFLHKHIHIDKYARLLDIDDVSLLLYAHPLGVGEQQLSPFGAITMSIFAEPQSIENSLAIIAEHIDHAPEEREKINSASLSQIQQLLLAGALRLV
jgi:hypothetical protein